MSSSLFPTFEPYWKKISKKLFGCFSQTSAYVKTAFAANIIGILGLTYLMVKSYLTATANEATGQSSDIWISGDWSGALVIVCFFFLSVSVALLVTSVKINDKMMILTSTVWGSVISIVVIWGIFFN